MCLRAALDMARATSATALDMVRAMCATVGLGRQHNPAVGRDDLPAPAPLSLLPHDEGTHKSPLQNPLEPRHEE